MRLSTVLSGSGHMWAFCAVGWGFVTVVTDTMLAAVLAAVCVWAAVRCWKLGFIIRAAERKGAEKQS